MCSARRGRPAGIPSTTETSFGPCDSPVVSQRSRDMLRVLCPRSRSPKRTERSDRGSCQAEGQEKATSWKPRGDALEVAIGAPPVDGAANEELVRFLAKRLEVPRRNVEIVRGESSHTKLIAVTGLDRETLLGRLFGGDA